MLYVFNFVLKFISALHWLTIQRNSHHKAILTRLTVQPMFIIARRYLESTSSQTPTTTGEHHLLAELNRFWWTFTAVFHNPGFHKHSRPTANDSEFLRCIEMSPHRTEQVDGIGWYDQGSQQAALLEIIKCEEIWWRAHRDGFMRHRHILNNSYVFNHPIYIRCKNVINIHIFLTVCMVIGYCIRSISLCMMSKCYPRGLEVVRYFFLT